MKFELTWVQMSNNPNRVFFDYDNAVSEPFIEIIDTEADRRYDGATTVKEIEDQFGELHPTDLDRGWYHHVQVCV